MGPNRVKVVMYWEIYQAKRFIGQVKYLSKFLQEWATRNSCCLTHKNAEWNWTHEQDDTFQRVKDAVCKVPVHKYFSKSDTTESQGDVSKDGLGFVLMQQHQPVTFANRALTLAEQKY